MNAADKVIDHYHQSIKKSAWMSSAIAAMGPATAGGVLVGIGGAAALTPVTGPAILAFVAGSSVATGIYKFLSERRELEKTRDNNLKGLLPDRQSVTTALPAAPEVASAAPVRNASISLRDGIKPREIDASTKMADIKLDMACDALSKIQDVPKGVEGESLVGKLLSRVKDSVNDRLYGRAGMDNPPSKNEAFGIMLQVSDAFTAGAKGAGDRFAFAFKDTLDAITTQVGTFVAKQILSKNQDMD